MGQNWQEITLSSPENVLDILPTSDTSYLISTASGKLIEMKCDSNNCWVTGTSPQPYVIEKLRLLDDGRLIALTENDGLLISVQPVVSSVNELEPEPQTAPSVRTFPNPIRGNELIVESDDLITSITVYNVDGRLVNETTLQTTKKLTHLDMSSLPSGTYYVRLQLDSGKIIVVNTQVMQ